MVRSLNVITPLSLEKNVRKSMVVKAIVSLWKLVILEVEDSSPSLFLPTRVPKINVY